MSSNGNANVPASAAQRLKPNASIQKQAEKKPTAATILADRLNKNEEAIGDISNKLNLLLQTLQGQGQQAHQPQVAQPQGIVQPSSVQQQVQPVQMFQQQQAQPVGITPTGVVQQPQNLVINRQEAGRQSRFENCSCCNQRMRAGTVSLQTGEYVASGLTTRWLQLQQGIIVTMASDGHRQQYQVSGQWLADELSKRQRGERATSVPGFLCGEPSSAHPTVRLVQPIMRRATETEEAQQYASRVLAEAARLQQQGYSL